MILDHVSGLFSQVDFWVVFPGSPETQISVLLGDKIFIL